MAVNNKYVLNQDSNGNAVFLTRQEAEELGLISNEDSETELEETKTSPFEDFFDEGDTARESDNKFEDSQEEIVGEVGKESDTKSEEILTSTHTQINNIPRNVSVAQISVISLASMAIVTGIAVLIAKAIKDGTTKHEAIRRTETKLNANSNKFYAIKKLDRVQTKLENAKKEKSISKFQKKISKISDKINKHNIKDKQELRLQKKYSNLGIAITGQKGYKGNKRLYLANAIDPAYDASAIHDHYKASKFASKAGLKESHGVSSKANKLYKASDRLMQKGDAPLGQLVNGIYFGKTNYFNTDTGKYPRFIHRCITDSNNLKIIFDKVEKANFFYAEPEIRVCKVNYTIKDETSTLVCSYDNKKGYEVLKAGLLKELETLIKNKSISNVEIKENVITQTNSKNIVGKLTGEYDLTQASDIPAIVEKIENADKTLKDFNSKFIQQREQ